MTFRRKGSGRFTRPGARLVLAVLLVAVMVPFGALPAMGAADDNTPGVAIPASPFVGTLDGDTETDIDDVYAVNLSAGQSLTVALKGPGDADFDLYLYAPGTTDVEVDPVEASSDWSGSIELLNYVADVSGTYYLDVYAFQGSGSYTLAWRIESEAAGLYVTPMEGLGRIETAIMSSRTAFSGGSEYVILATSRSFPDALGGSALAGVLDAPILLTEPGALPDAVATEILDNLGATKAIILGGTGAVSTDVEDDLIAMLGAENVERIGGLSRYDTAEQIAVRVLDEVAVRIGDPGPDFAFVATGESFPDALAASSWGSWDYVPFFLVGPGTDPGAFAETLTTANVSRIRILGGTGAVSPAIQTATEAAGITTIERLAGIGRYETAAAIAEAFVVDDAAFSTVAVTTGQDFPDALAGGAALGRYGVPIVLTPPTSLHSAARDVLEGHADTIQDLFFLGGTGAVSVPVRRDVRLAIAGGLPGFSSLGLSDSHTLPAAPALDPALSNRAK